MRIDEEFTPIPERLKREIQRAAVEMEVKALEDLLEALEVKKGVLEFEQAWREEVWDNLDMLYAKELRRF